MGLETRRINTATDDDRHGTSPRDHIQWRIQDGVFGQMPPPPSRNCI